MLAPVLLLARAAVLPPQSDLEPTHQKATIERGEIHLAPTFTFSFDASSLAAFSCVVSFAFFAGCLLNQSTIIATSGSGFGQPWPLPLRTSSFAGTLASSSFLIIRCDCSIGTILSASP